VRLGLPGPRRISNVLNKRQILGLVLSFLVLLALLSPQAKSYYYLPVEQRISVGEPIEILLNLPPSVLNSINIYVKEGENLIAWDENTQSSSLLKEPGKFQLQLKLFDFIPLKQISIDVQPDIHIIPGGHSIGVLLRTEGVMVVGFSPILDENDEPSFPAKDGGIAVGDVIVEVNNKKITTDDQVKDIINSWQPEDVSIAFTIERNNILQQKVVYPKYCKDTSSYRIGLFIRDNAGGVGTLTFYDPLTKKFGALGHVITDSESNQVIKILQGKIMTAAVENIQKAKRGLPGEKVGVFLDNNELGSIEKNDTCGIYGQAHKDIINTLYPKGLPIAYANQISTGKAEILTVIKGEKINKYKIEIEKIMNGRQDNKNMIIRIDDEELIASTGGIIQGMSGSPIIQNGKIIGAVTHVFVNDPQRGYAVFIENMLFEAGILQKERTLGATSSRFFL
jgi:stage IV sporulation protein B